MTADRSNPDDRSVLIVGAGPAGLAAAETLAAHGVPADLIDENPRPGGAISRRPFSASARTLAGDAQELGPNVRFHAGSVCHGFNQGKPVISQVGRLRRFDPLATIIATGARERIRPVTGGALGGVMACGAAQTLLKGSARFPYRSAVVAGSGPLLLATASQLIDAGVSIRAVVEESRLLKNVSIATAMNVARSLPVNVAKEGAQYLATILRHGAKFYSGYRIGSIEGSSRVTGLELTAIENGRPSASSKTISIQCDSVVLGYGFVSSSELVQQAGADVRFDEASRYWTPVRTGAFETTVPGLYSVGDCCGVQGKDVAHLEGFLAAVDVLRQGYGIDVDAPSVRKARRRYRKLALFQQTMGTLFPQPKLAGIPGAATVCRCEGVTQNEVDDAVQHGASDFRSVKLWTRAGMGICQGRTCQPVLADYLAEGGEVEPPQVRFPVRPLPFRAAESL